MNIIAFFTESGIPRTALSPTIRIRTVADNALVVTDAAMSEVGDGFYKYDFAQYTGSVDYAIRCDGTNALTGSERYTFAGNENYVDDVWNASTSAYSSGSAGYALDFTYNINSGRWKIINNQMIFYKEDNITEVVRFNLFDSSGNPTMDSPFERQKV